MKIRTQREKDRVCERVTNNKEKCENADGDVMQLPDAILS